MARTYGRISEFDSSKEDWKVYEERLSYFFEANEITEATKKRAIFFVLGGCLYVRPPEKPSGSL